MSECLAKARAPFLNFSGFAISTDVPSKVSARARRWRLHVHAGHSFAEVRAHLIASAFAGEPMPPGILRGALVRNIS